MARLLRIALLCLLAAPSWAATTTISGSDDEGTFLRNDQTSYNNGGNTLHAAGKGSSRVRRALYRYDESLIPAGTITGHTLSVWRWAYAESASGNTTRVYKVKAGNTWVAGSAFQAAQTGSASWSHAKYATQSWTGSSGCGTSGTDYDSTYLDTWTHPAYTSGADVEHVWDLTTAVATDWRDTPSNNQGVIFISTDESTNNAALWWWSPVAAASKDPTVTITYDPAYTGAILMHPL